MGTTSAAPGSPGGVCTGSGCEKAGKDRQAVDPALIANPTYAPRTVPNGDESTPRPVTARGGGAATVCDLLRYNYLRRNASGNPERFMNMFAILPPRVSPAAGRPRR